MRALRLHPVSFNLIPQEARLLVCTTPARFPSSVQDDMEEPIDFGAWLNEHPAASYVMRVDGHTITDAGIVHGDFIVVSRANKERLGEIMAIMYLFGPRRCAT